MFQANDQFSYRVIGLAMEVHRELGPGLDEVFYHELLKAKLKAAGIPFQSKPRGKLIHRGIVADEFEADFIVAGELGLELKVLWGNFPPEHLLQVICYIKFWKLLAALLFDFGKESLAHRRVEFTEPEHAFAPDMMLKGAPAFVADASALRDLAQAISGVLAEHGLGYRDTTYRGLLFAELKANGVEIVREPLVAIRGPTTVLGETHLPSLVLPGRCAVLVTALRETRQAADRAVLQTHLRYLELPWGLLVNFGKRNLEWAFAVKPRGSPRIQSAPE